MHMTLIVPAGMTSMRYEQSPPPYSVTRAADQAWDGRSVSGTVYGHRAADELATAPATRTQTVEPTRHTDQTSLSYSTSGLT